MTNEPTQDPMAAGAGTADEATPNEVLAIFARAPRTGEVKTRLIPRLGEEGALDFYRAALLDTIESAASLPYRRVVFCTPEQNADLDLLRAAGVDEEITFQQGSSLGERMQNALSALFGRRAKGSPSDASSGGSVDRVVLIGTDSPDLPAQTIESAFAALRDFDTTLGPAMDGGYTLVGLRRASLPLWASHDLFEGVQWSTDDTLYQTVRRFRELGLTTSLQAPWWDVDMPEDLDRLETRLRMQLELGTLRARRCAAYFGIL
ncbi:MAG: TIGR04282 family arsenosugar biosynthesis glycosyltransferase [Candidatus Eisenbacteria bacterium]|uniref:TIGR04282 family arsenosugar biosynthesis glycosyltransferase n=1 Tax=Eiseniibacteriota bacterium TaxID=2212470 RepID=A0A956NBQ6_UNCEI|nr:TIGR04282 family arsenosugar biosynthesis glycosyltransferase [Candidatus Eisenbacteria bacterium]